jgi:hypothetical protein
MARMVEASDRAAKREAGHEWEAASARVGQGIVELRALAAEIDREIERRESSFWYRLNQRLRAIGL